MFEACFEVSVEYFFTPGELLIGVFFHPAGVGVGDEGLGAVGPVGVKADEKVGFVPFDGVAVHGAFAAVGGVKPKADEAVFVGHAAGGGAALEHAGVADFAGIHAPAFFGDPQGA